VKKIYKPKLERIIMTKDRHPVPEVPTRPVQEVEVEVIDKIANMVFSNVKLYIEAEMKKLAPLFIDVFDLKANVATLSSLLHNAEAFTEEEFRACFVAIRESFGNVNFDGSIDGKITMIKYNFES